MKGMNGTEALAAAGSLNGNAVSLDITASVGSIFELVMAAEGNSVAGDFR